MRLLWCRAFRIATVASYTLVLTAGGWFHDHQGSTCSEGGHFCAAHACRGALPVHECPNAASDDHAGLHVRSAGHGPVLHEHASCPICQFLSQRPAGASHAASVVFAPLAEQVTLLEPAPVALLLVRSFQIRAPPSLA